MCPAGRDKDGARSFDGGKVDGGGERVWVESEDGPTAIIMEGAQPLATCNMPTGASRLEGASIFLGRKTFQPLADSYHLAIMTS
jgi:hypothetical protein